MASRNHQGPKKQLSRFLRAQQKKSISLTFLAAGYPLDPFYFAGLAYKEEMLSIRLVEDVIEANFTPILSLLVFFVVLLCWGSVGHLWKCVIVVLVCFIIAAEHPWEPGSEDKDAETCLFVAHSFT
jgi:hypothetical protein